MTEYLAEQLGIADPSCLKEYGERDGTARTHAGEFQEAGGWRDFAEVRDELSVWLDARAWTTGDGPKSLSDAAAGWLRERRVLLPGASRLARLVGSVREVANNRLWDTLYGRFLLLKVATVGVALTWGAVHHFVVRPRLEAGEDPDVHPSLVGEVAVAFAVLLAAAILTNVAPPPVDTGTPPVARPAR